jgi:thioredoxin 1
MVFDTPINTTDQSIERVLAVNLPVALVFIEGGSLDEALNRLARQHAGQALIVKVNPKDNPASLRRFDISTTPALVTVRAGQARTRVAPVSAGDLEPQLLYLLGRGPKPAAREQRPDGRARAGAAGGAGAPIVATDASFDQQVLRSPEPVLVDFWAPWCAPCRMIAPIIDRLAQEQAGRLRVVKVNVDENPRIQARYGIQSIPTMMVFKAGQTVDRWAGALPEPALRARVMQQLG